MSTEWAVGRKAIIAYLRPYLGLSQDVVPAWRAIRRWIHNYDLMVRHLPNGVPYIDKTEFEAWYERFKSRSRSK